MKKFITLLLICAMALSLGACGNKAPTLEDVEEAISTGVVTVEDALEKGWVDEQWVKDYNAKKAEDAVPASNKLQSNMLGEFSTQTMEGNSFTNKDLSTVTFIAFLNPRDDMAKEQYAIIESKYEDILAADGEVLIVNTSGEKSDFFANAKFSVVYYNDSVKTALGNLVDMVKVDGFSGSWNVNGSFLSAWSMKLDAEGIMVTLDSMWEMLEGSDNNSDNSTTAAITTY